MPWTPRLRGLDSAWRRLPSDEHHRNTFPSLFDTVLLVSTLERIAAARRLSAFADETV
jgi:hypothetical protein